MSKVYLMQRFDMNEGFPDSSPKGIEPYISTSFVLMHQDGTIIPLEERGFGNVRELSGKLAQGFKKLQDKGFEIIGDVHPFYREPINIDGDLEVYQPFCPTSTEYNILTQKGVKVSHREVA